MKFYLIFIFILSQLLSETIGKSGKTHNKPHKTTTTEEPEIELEPETTTTPKPERTPVPLPTTTPATTTTLRTTEVPKPETEWTPIRTTTTITRTPYPTPEPEITQTPIRTTTSTTTKRTRPPIAEWTPPPIRTTTPRTTTTLRTTEKPKPEAEWTPIRTTTTTQKPYPSHESTPEFEWTSIRTTTSTTQRPHPSPESQTPIRTTTSEPEWTPIQTTTTTTQTQYPTPEPERTQLPIRTTTSSTTTIKIPIEEPFPPNYPIPPTNSGSPEECQRIRCRAGYRCDCINPCPASCRYPNRRPCTTYVCKVGCVCDKGYVLNGSGICVAINSCQQPPPPAGPVCKNSCSYEKQCVCENPCPATCADPDPTPCPTLQCNPGCYSVCRKGYVLDRTGGECIPIQYCPNRQCVQQPYNLHENEVYYECSTRLCSRTCDNPDVYCTGQCIRPGNLDCKPGFVRDLRTGKCVLNQQCTQPLLCDRKNEVFYECDTRVCQRTCQRPDPFCTAQCRYPGTCDCMPGLVRDLKTCRCVDKNEPTCLAQRIPVPEYHIKND